jgi:DNA helicase IV
MSVKVLTAPRPTPEQLRIIGDTRIGIEIIRGAAGSGKTTTALLRLKNLTDMFRARHARLRVIRPVRALMLTYNRTLCGYVEELARNQASISAGGVDLTVSTYAQWARQFAEDPKICAIRNAQILARQSGLDIRLPPEFLCSEVEYILGRFPGDHSGYLDAERTGRGLAPRVERGARLQILELISRYRRSLMARGELDWEDLPAHVAASSDDQYDIVVIDEAQDFSANQLRSIHSHLKTPFSLTLIIDTAQRLYPRGYTWAEAGIDRRAVSFYRLQQNHRNTVEVATFAKGILSGLSIDDDGTLPDFSKATRHGPRPVVFKGRYSEQVDFAIRMIREDIDLDKESAAFLKPLGGGWFEQLRIRLARERLQFEEITRSRDWPDSDANIALSTMHSAKGLEFDHVIILGLNDEVTPHGREADDDRLETLRRLLGMAVARARKTVMIGYKEEEASSLVRYFEPGTYDEYEQS